MLTAVLAVPKLDLSGTYEAEGRRGSRLLMLEAWLELRGRWAAVGSRNAVAMVPQANWLW